ncbi:MAG: RnfABCDGE type electron transport complex subunit D [Saprospiraceae bacterium]|nr:RnfABCDGE type electron transport complex subunit D [Saprospiraceae bacterium]
MTLSMMKTIISSSPFLRSGLSTPRIMWEVVITLVPVVGMAAWVFGISALLMTLVCVLACWMAERIFLPPAPGASVLGDGSAVITGILLALCLPPGFPFWMAFLGGFVAIALGKAMWGGLGHNVFNPALLGRAFLQAAFPGAITTWSAPATSFFALRGSNLALPFLKGESVDAMTGATPLSAMKFTHQAADWQDLLIGQVSGSLGETSGGLFLLLGLYLAWRGLINWRIPVGMIATVGLFSGILYWIDPAHYAPPQFMILAGGLMLGAVYMATDLVSSPLTHKGIWIYAVGIGILVVMIRVWGGLPEGVMYAILLMNAVTPLINRALPTRVYGHASPTS